MEQKVLRALILIVAGTIGGVLLTGCATAYAKAPMRAAKESPKAPVAAEPQYKPDVQANLYGDVEADLFVCGWRDGDKTKPMDCIDFRAFVAEMNKGKGQPHEL